MKRAQTSIVQRERGCAVRRPAATEFQRGPGKRWCCSRVLQVVTPNEDVRRTPTPDAPPVSVDGVRRALSWRPRRRSRLCWAIRLAVSRVNEAGDRSIVHSVAVRHLGGQVERRCKPIACGTKIAFDRTPYWSGHAISSPAQRPLKDIEPRWSDGDGRHCQCRARAVERATAGRSDETAPQGARRACPAKYRNGAKRIAATGAS
jgi:hypothetical protein